MKIQLFRIIEKFSLLEKGNVKCISPRRRKQKHLPPFVCLQENKFKQLINPNNNYRQLDYFESGLIGKVAKRR